MVYLGRGYQPLAASKSNGKRPGIFAEAFKTRHMETTGVLSIPTRVSHRMACHWASSTDEGEAGRRCRHSCTYSNHSRGCWVPGRGLEGPPMSMHALDQAPAALVTTQACWPLVTSTGEQSCVIRAQNDHLGLYLGAMIHRERHEPPNAHRARVPRRVINALPCPRSCALPRQKRFRCRHTAS